ncbi:MAG: ribosome maturation factor RimM [Thermodesulfovibrionales bacterium]
MHHSEKFITIGKVAKTHGADGSLRVIPLTHDPGRFSSLTRVFFDLDGELVRAEVASVRVHSAHVALKVRGWDTPERAARLADCEIKIPSSESPALPEGVYYHYQILGLDVFTEGGDFIGKVREIIETGSNDVYSVVDDARETLIPAIADVVLAIDLDSGRIIIREVEGLLT